MNFKEHFFNAAMSKNGYCGNCVCIYTSENIISKNSEQNLPDALFVRVKRVLTRAALPHD